MFCNPPKHVVLEICFRAVFVLTTATCFFICTKVWMILSDGRQAGK
ncbi:unnamed protein product [Gulo gulo]|uniref:Uncharacterized protein n=1 Tax=Gulo gulo TaxID=48420 RepID=A0A9X9LSC7_GULGU|nr:unnamed protein product [Gulo gulo]